MYFNWLEAPFGFLSTLQCFYVAGGSKRFERTCGAYKSCSSLPCKLQCLSRNCAAFPPFMTKILKRKRNSLKTCVTVPCPVNEHATGAEVSAASATCESKRPVRLKLRACWSWFFLSAFNGNSSYLCSRCKPSCTSNSIISVQLLPPPRQQHLKSFMTMSATVPSWRPRRIRRSMRRVNPVKQSFDLWRLLPMSLQP